MAIAAAVFAETVRDEDKAAELARGRQPSVIEDCESIRALEGGFSFDHGGGDAAAVVFFHDGESVEFSEK